MSDKDIAVVGMSCLFPDADNIQTFWNNIANGVDSIKDAPENRIDPRLFKQKQVGEVDKFYFHKGAFIDSIKVDLFRYGILPIAAEGIDPEHLIVMRLVDDALADAGVYEKKISMKKGCFILGKGNYVSISGGRLAELIHVPFMLEDVIKFIVSDLPDEDVEKIKQEYKSEQIRFNADTAAGAMPNMVVSLAANKFDIKGPAYTVDAACASSLIAVEQCINLLHSGQCDIALAGGSHVGQGASFWSIFNVIGAASGKQQIAPFSEDADGILVGEGVGIVVLKKLEKAIADNDRIYAVIKGSSVCSDGGDVSVMAPSKKGQVMTLKLAWEKAGMDPKRIGYVETHGTATQVGDRTEIATLTEFFGDNSAPPALLGSVKSNIGHAMPAAGIAGLIKTILALYHKKIPPTLHCENPMKAMYKSRFLPAQKLVDWDGKNYPLVAAVNAFGFGGVNTHVILEAYDAESMAKKQNSTVGSSIGSGEGEIVEMINKKQKGKIIDVAAIERKVIKFDAMKGIVDDYVQKTSSLLSSVPEFSEKDLEDPVLRDIHKNLVEIGQIQKNLLKWRQTPLSHQQPQRIATDVDKNIMPVQPVIGSDWKKKGDEVEKTLRLTLEEHPYLLDHSVVRQPKNWPHLEDLNPVVPFAMTIELLFENAQELLPGKKALKLSSAGVLKWIQVVTPFSAQLTGKWKSADCISFTIPGHASGDVTLGDEFPPVPEEYTKDINLGNSIVPRIPGKDEIYTYFLFHGPQYHSIKEVTKVTEKGLHAYIQKTEGKGSLLDNLGSLLGLYCHLAVKENRTTFPMSVEEIQFYQDFRDQSGVFEYTLLIREIKDNEMISDVVIKRKGKVWCIVKGFHNRRFDYDNNLMNVIIRPTRCSVVLNLDTNVFYYYNVQARASSMDFLYERYLNAKERKHYKSLYLNQGRDYLISRIALKDAIRLYLRKEEREHLVYPIEIGIDYDSNGKPHVSGERFKGIEISIAHKGSEVVVIVSDKPVGIDIEKVEAKDASFKEMAFTQKELSMISQQNDEAEWMARFWVAKEAYGKMLGLGLQGNPKQYEVTSIKKEELTVGNAVIRTVRHREHFIVGWTL